MPRVGYASAGVVRNMSATCRLAWMRRAGGAGPGRPILLPHGAVAGRGGEAGGLWSPRTGPADRLRGGGAGPALRMIGLGPRHQRRGAGGGLGRGSWWPGGAVRVEGPTERGVLRPNDVRARVLSGGAPSPGAGFARRGRSPGVGHHRSQRVARGAWLADHGSRIMARQAGRLRSVACVSFAEVRLLGHLAAGAQVSFAAAGAILGRSANGGGIASPVWVAGGMASGRDLRGHGARHAPCGRGSRGSGLVGSAPLGSAPRGSVPGGTAPGRKCLGGEWARAGCCRRPASVCPHGAGGFQSRCRGHDHRAASGHSAAVRRGSGRDRAGRHGRGVRGDSGGM